MMLWIDFDELVEAFDFCSENLNFFIDLENNKIIFINKMEENVEKKLEKIRGDRYIEIPKNEPKDELNIMESFIYEIHEGGFELAEKCHEALEKKTPFRNFKELLKEQGEELEIKWHKFREKEFR